MTNNPQQVQQEEAKIVDPSPLKAAADLINSLDMAYTEMTNNAADAARDAENARKNARAASEIARRYLHRSYPKDTPSRPFGASPPRPSPNPRSQKNPFAAMDDSKQQDQQQQQQQEEDPIDGLLAINGIASGLQSPPRNHRLQSPPRNHHEESKTFEPRKRRTYKNPSSSSERIAQSHAEDVLRLSMELERAKQGWKSEERMHDGTKTSLASYKVKHQNLEEQNQNLVKELEIIRQESTQTISDLEQELANSKLRLQAAEEDAELALDLAKESAEKRDQVEEWLQLALQELEQFKAGKAFSEEKNSLETPKRSVRFADDATTSMTPRGVETPRSMVAAGRQLLRRSMASPGEAILTLELTPAKSAERRRRLKDRLTNLEEDLPTPQKTSPSRALVETNNNPSHKKLIDECQGAAKLLQESGQRIHLGGHWWRDRSVAANNMMSHHENFHLEAMTRQYSQSVEVSMAWQSLQFLYVFSILPCVRWK